MDPDVLGVRVDSVDLRVPQGRAPKVLEKAGRVGLDFIRTRSGDSGRTPTFRGSGQVGLSSIDLGVPRDRALKVLRRTGRGSPGCQQAYWIP